MKHSTCLGFSLIEFALYLGLLSVVVTISFVWLGTLSGPVMQRQITLDGLIDLHLARDIMVADIKKGAIDPQSWNAQPKNQLLWNAGDTDVCWECRNEKLFRITGKYLVKTKQWLNKKQAVVAQGITIFSPKLDRAMDGTLKNVEIFLSGKSKECVASAAPCCGRKVL